MIINSKEELIQHLEKTDKKNIKKNVPTLDVQEYELRNITFEDYEFSKDFKGLEVKNCKFIHCKFENIFGFFFLFSKSTFEKCEFRNSRFSHLEECWEELQFINCSFKNVQLDEGALFNIWFEDCFFQSFSILGMYPLSYVCFQKCIIENSQFQSLISYEDINEIDKEVEDLVFQESSIEFSYFNSVDLRNSFFIDTKLYKSSFIDCQLHSGAISQNIDSEYPNYASIDLQSILKSDNFDKLILEKYFNIYDPDIKPIVQGITSKIDFKSVFISYSFKDKTVAHLLNEELSKRGIKTFLWEKDAPGGHTLKDIMSSNIKRHDRILFIASSNSIRSQACQYELSEGRKKQELTWENIFFPLHIDNFLFEVTKEIIRPIDKAEEYWGNIEELKRVNSTDFSKFNSLHYEEEELDISIKQIIN
jgi:uncharacterized protein YjbI with pentapeptide repeats